MAVFNNALQTIRKTKRILSLATKIFRTHGVIAFIRFLRRPPLALPPLSCGCVTVVIPALNEAERIADVVTYALSDPATAEVIVIDDGSTDDTVALAENAGARVFTSSMLGKGASMRDGIECATCQVIVFLDGDLSGLQPNIVTHLSRPIFRNEADFVKARFGRGGGRVTELTAKPMIKIFFPEIADIAQPLGGMIAGRKDLFTQLHFEDGYGVDVGLLLDSYMKGAQIVEVDIGHIEHCSQPLTDLTAMANEVSRVIFHRAKRAGRLHVEQISAMFESQRQAAASIDFILSRRKGRQKICLLDMDGTVTPSRYTVELARKINKEQELTDTLHSHDTDAVANYAYQDSLRRAGAIANIFRFVHKRTFEEVARTIEIREGVAEFVKELRKRGFMVGIVSDSYFIAAEIIRRRIFADFALAHTLTFIDDICRGELQINPAFLPPEKGAALCVCKSNVLRCFLADAANGPITESWAVGDNVNDLNLLCAVDKAFTICPKSPTLTSTPSIAKIDSFAELCAKLDEPGDRNNLVPISLSSQNPAPQKACARICRN